LSVYYYFFRIISFWFSQSEYGTERLMDNLLFVENSASSGGNDIADNSDNGQLFYTVLTITNSAYYLSGCGAFTFISFFFFFCLFICFYFYCFFFPLLFLQSQLYHPQFPHCQKQLSLWLFDIHNPQCVLFISGVCKP
jgi:hypothetical protein